VVFTYDVEFSRCVCSSLTLSCCFSRSHAGSLLLTTITLHVCLDCRPFSLGSSTVSRHPRPLTPE